MTATEQYIEALARLKTATLGYCAHMPDKNSMNLSMDSTCSRAFGGRCGKRTNEHRAARWLG